MAHSWTIRFLEHRIADKRILRLIAKWLKVGITEEGRVTRSERGTPQGAVISPILANVYLHYVYDLWTHRWRRKATGDVIVIRYADDSIVGFQHEHDAKAFLHDLQERMREFELALHPAKTRLIRFGRHAEPGALAAHAGICAGGGQQWPSLPRPYSAARDGARLPLSRREGLRLA